MCWILVLPLLIIAYFLLPFQQQVTYGHIVIDAKTQNTDCLNGAVLFIKNEQIPLTIQLIGSGSLINSSPMIRLDTDWGVHYDTTLRLWNTNHISGTGAILLNSGRMAQTQKFLNFQACGFSKFFHSGNFTMILSSTNGIISYKHD